MSSSIRAVGVVAAFITYGSLHPFDFGLPANAGEMFQAFLADWRLWTSRGDVLGNVGLFVPFGLAGVWWARGRSERIRAAVATFAGGVVFAFAIQVVQVWVASRSARLADVVWNAAGIAAGIAAAFVLGGNRVTRRVVMEPTRAAALALVGLWLLAELAPLVPSIDLGGIRRSLRPLLVAPRFDLVDAVYRAAEVLLASRLLAVVAGPRLMPAATAAAIAVVLAGKLVIIGQSVDWTIVGGFAVGFGLALALGRLRHDVAVTATLAFVLFGYTLQSLAPFALRPAAAFLWIPFGAVLQGTMLTNLRALATVGFVLGGAVWLMRDRGWRPVPAGAVLALWVLALEIGQVWLAGRTASSTEPVMALVAGWALAQVPAGSMLRHRR